MSRVKKVIFVCTDNTCLSNMAAACLDRIHPDPEVPVISRGLVVLFPEPVNPKAVSIMKSKGLEPLEEKSRELTLEDFIPNTLVLTMTQAEKLLVQERFPEMPNIFTIGEFTMGRQEDLIVPTGGSLADYGKCFEYLDLLVKIAEGIIFKEEE